MGLLAIPLILLYLLRQKRPDLSISSTLLWSKALADMRASTPFQRLRRNLLLLLQLLVLAGLVFTLMRPVVQAQASSSVAGVIVIDASASMQATDGNDAGQTRLEFAKAQAHQLVDAMRTGDRFMLLADGGGLSQVRSGFIGSKAELHRLIDDIRPADTTSDLSETLLLAATSLRALKPAPGSNRTEALAAGRIWLFSDGVGVSLPGVPELDRWLKYVRIGSSSKNVGIIRVAVTPVPKEPKAYQVFVGLYNASAESRAVVVGLAHGRPDRFLATQRVALNAGAQGGAVFERITCEPGRLYVQIDAKEDDFPLDNTAFALVEPPRKIRVTAVSAGNRHLQNFLRTATRLGEIEGSFIDPAAYDPKMPADLFIFDKIAPKNLPACDTLLIRPPAPIDGFKVVGRLDHPALLRWQRDDPLFSFVDLADIHLFTALKLEHDPENRDLILSTQGPLLSSRDVGSSRRYYLAFDPMEDADWWAQPSLLIFLENLIQQTRVRHFIGTPQILSTGAAARLWDLDVQTTITLPGGGQVTLQPLDGAAEFPATDHVGFYDVHSGNKQAAFAVNLFSPVASNILPRPLELQGGGDVEEVSSVATINREIWPWLVLVALGLLMLEWWVYHRRIA